MKNIFIAAISLIITTMIVLFTNIEEVQEFMVDEKVLGFWGSLIGALLTGIIAIVVFIIGKKYDENKVNKMVSNHMSLIRKIHDESNKDLLMFLDFGKKNIAKLDGNYKVSFYKLINNSNLLGLLNLADVAKESDQSLKLMQYVIYYQDAVQILKDNFDVVYGGSFFKYGVKNEEIIQRLDNNIIIMNELIRNFK